MFVGHFGAAFAATKLKGAPSLPVLLIAGQATDYGFFALSFFGIERFRIDEGLMKLSDLDLMHMPWTHSLVATAVWAAGFGLLVWLLTRRASAGWTGAAVVASHWLLDLLVHRPDLTLAGSPPKLGLGLWNVPPVEIPLELSILIGGAWLYSRAIPSATTAGRVALWLLVAALVVLQFVNWFVPPSFTAPPLIALQALSVFAVVALLGWGVDRLRKRSPRAA